MTHCTSFDEHISEHALGTLSGADAENLESHLAGCPACRAELKARTALLSHVHPDRSEPEEAFWDSFTDTVMAKVERPDRPAFLHTLFPASQPWIIRVAAAVLLIATGIAIGRAGLQQNPGYTSSEEEPVLNVSTAALSGTFEVLERSRTLLLDLVNTDSAEGAPNLEQRQRVAEELATRSAELYEQLSPGEQARLRALLQDLELILLQIAHIESGTDIPGIEMIRDGVDRSAVLFKIELESLGRVTDAAPSP